ncbi:MAG: DUF554 domain-containing protein [Pseudomonadota bacterium]
MIFPLGSLINAAAIILGGGVGMILGSRLPDRIRHIVFQGLGLCTMVIGLKMALTMNNALVVIFSIAGGGIIGEIVGIENGLMRMADALKKRIRTGNPRFTEGFVSTAVMFCVGSMAILGPFDEGLRGDTTILMTKSILDGLFSVGFAAAMGLGVLFSSVPVFIYQGVLTIFAGFLQPYLSPAIMTELTATGGILIVGIGINIMEIKKIPLANMLPALPLAIVLAHFFA